MNSLPKTVTRQRRDCDLNPGPSAPESSTLTSNHSATEPVSVGARVSTGSSLLATIVLMMPLISYVLNAESGRWADTPIH